MNPLDQKFRSELRELETPLGSHLTFERVMEKRKATGAPIWGKFAAALLVISTAGISAWNWLGNAQPAPRHAVSTRLVSPSLSEANSPVSAAPLKSQISSQSAQQSTQQTKNSTTYHHSSQSSRAGLSSFLQQGQSRLVVSTPSNAANQGAATPSAENNAFNTASENGDQSPQINETVANENVTGQAVQTEAKEKWMTSKFLRNYQYPQWVVGTTPVGMDFDLRPTHSRKANKWAVEITSDHGFDGVNAGKGSIEARQSFASHYQGSLIFKLNQKYELGIGFGFGNMSGQATDRFTEEWQETKINVIPVVIKQPGLPDIIIYRNDTTTVKQSVDRSVGLSYSIRKFYLPISFIHQVKAGPVQLRMGAALAPGIAQVNNRIFNRNEWKNVGTSQIMTYDLRFGVGAMMPITSKMSFIAEPYIKYNHLVGKEFRNFSRTNYGVGFGIRYSLK